MGPLQNTGTWYKNTLLDCKQHRGARKTKRLHVHHSKRKISFHLVIYYPARFFLDHVSVFCKGPIVRLSSGLSFFPICSGLYGVGKAAENPPALVVLSHTPASATRTIAWVGKGIVYDTGGLCIKAKVCSAVL